MIIVGKNLAAARDSDSESDSDDDAGGSDASDDGNAARALPGLRSPSAVEPMAQNKKGSAQAEKLYTESNQFNPAAARADKKRRKKEKKVSLGDDFDFAEAFADEVVLDDEVNASDDNV